MVGGDFVGGEVTRYPQGKGELKGSLGRGELSTVVSPTSRFTNILARVALEAWLVLTSVKYHGNLYILIPLNQRLALTRLRATGPPCSPTCEVVSRTSWVSSPLTAFAWSVAERRRYIQAYRTFLYHGWENQAYTCAALVSLLSGTT